MEAIGFEQFDEQLAFARLREASRKIDALELDNETINEAYRDAVKSLFRMEDIGWQALGGPQDNTPGGDLAAVKSIASKLSEWVISNPLLGRGLEIRCSYLFGEPYEIGTEKAESDITPQQRNIILKPENQDAVFGLDALATIEGQRYEAGNAFVQYDRTEKQFQVISLEWVADIIYNPDNPAEVRYVKLEYTRPVILTDGSRKDEAYAVWIPANKYKGPYVDQILDAAGRPVAVDTSKRMIVSRARTKPGATLGIPDAFAAAPWALAYSAYLRDGTKVLAALAEWVWKITPKKRPAAERAATAVRENRGAGGSLITDMDVQSLPKQDAVDLNTGRPLAAQVASALGISIVVLLSDPGQSGAYGTAQTLADPNRRTMQARRELNTEFLKECLQLIGVKEPAITWAKMAPGTDKEEMELMAQAWGTGLFEPLEVRPRIAKIAQITVTSETPPEGVIIPNNLESMRMTTAASAPPVAEVDPDGTTRMNNGVGRDNVGAGALSRSKTDKTQAGAEK